MDRLHRHANCEIDLFDFIPFAALDIICETAMGVRINAQSNPTNDYVRAVMSQSEIVFGRFLNPFMPDWWFNRTTLGRQEQKNIETLHRFTMEVIQQKMSNDNFNCSEASRKRFVFIDLLVNQYHNAKIEIEDIREEVDTFMFEGFDTTTSAISWIVFLLGHHPHCQKRLYDEIEEWWPLSASIPSIDSNCLAALKYLDACVKESLRLFPSVPIIGRRLSKSIQFGSYIVPKHATTIVYLYGLHRNGATFPQPNQFRPERFLGNANLNRAHSFGFLPFSAGQRNCIGQKLALLEIKLMILYLIRSFRIESLVALDQVSISVELVMRPKSKMAIRLIAR